MNQKPLYPDFEFLAEVEAYGPFAAAACFQCRKCSNGCPVTFAMDIYPDEVIRRVILGQRESVLSCRTIWVCAACETCTTRCPNEVKIAELMDCLKEMTIKAKIPCPQAQVLSMHETFLKNVQRHGRVHETSFLTEYLLRSGQLKQRWQDGTWPAEINLGWRLFSKGRLPLFAKGSRHKKEVRQILKRTEQRSKI